MKMINVLAKIANKYVSKKKIALFSNSLDACSFSLVLSDNCILTLRIKSTADLITLDLKSPDSLRKLESAIKVAINMRSHLSRCVSMLRSHTERNYQNSYAVVLDPHFWDYSKDKIGLVYLGGSHFIYKFIEKSVNLSYLRGEDFYKYDITVPYKQNVEQLLNSFDRLKKGR